MNVEKSLQNAGVDTKKYPSLSMQNILGYKCKPFGENSHWYKQIMEDGHVFNPYIHRRWLPHQFMDKVYWTVRYNHGLTYNDVFRKYEIEISDSDNFHSTYQKLIKELNAQYTLFKRDKKAYKEREAAFFNSKAFRHLLGVEEIDLMTPDNYQYAKEILKLESKDASTRRWEYQRCKLGQDRMLRSKVACSFINAGVYFTLKHIVMFDWESLKMGEWKQKDFLKDMRENLVNGGFSFEAAFEMIKEYVSEGYDPCRFY